ncbi:MAG TPA: formate dehydrogenase accessory sulfurtransferase FdhD [Candidatus Saccharimonadales bacterium]|jgi:FdhD protein|nr:formate dehydrogenase accessory sulfurtransferase FdhD [Candidatus Saccharimonadales bacterium]
MAQKKRSIDLTQVTQWEDGIATRVEDYLATEEPLEMRSGKFPLGVTLRTPGNDEELVAGFLFTEGIISRREDLISLQLPSDKSEERNFVGVTLHSDIDLEAASTTHRFSAGSACGVCGKATIAQLRRRGLRRPKSTIFFDPEMLCRLPPRLRAAQDVFGHTGGLHAAALFTATGELLVVREDIGRHNAVDKAIGWALLGGRLPLSDHVLLVSGRGGFEIIQKSIAAGIPLLASVSAPSSLAVQLSRELGLTLVGFLRGRRFVIYAGEERIAASASALHGGS